MLHEEKKLDIEVSHGSDPLIDEITQNIGVESGRIHFMDVLYNAIENSPDSNNFSAFIYGTDQERHHEEKRHYSPHKQYCSGPLAKSKFLTTKREVIGRMGVLLPIPKQMRQHAQNVFADFARRFFAKELADTKEFKTEEKIEKPIKWLLSGHSRGGMIARILANSEPKTCVLENGVTVMISAPAPDNTRELIILIKDENEKIQRKRYILEMNILNFSATAGPRLKGVKDFVETRPVRLLDFLAVRDIGNGYGQGMKPFNQRRTISPNSATTFLHIPVDHPTVTKADKKRKLHMEIELLTTYLYFKHIGQWH